MGATTRNPQITGPQPRPLTHDDFAGDRAILTFDAIVLDLVLLPADLAQLAAADPDRDPRRRLCQLVRGHLRSLTRRERPRPNTPPDDDAASSPEPAA